jgi:RF-1 domain
MRHLRSTWTDLSDAQLLGQCEVDTYRASGPGGQKRNKTSSAVRLRHLPSGLIVIAEESRSQHENKAKALKRLRRALYLELRDPIDVQSIQDNPLWRKMLDSEHRVALGKRDERFWPAAGIVMDALAALDARVSDAASALGITTGNLVDFLQQDPKLWQQANVLRAKHGQKPLKS